MSKQQQPKPDRLPAVTTKQAIEHQQNPGGWWKGKICPQPKDGKR